MITEEKEKENKFKYIMIKQQQRHTHTLTHNIIIQNATHTTEKVNKMKKKSSHWELYIEKKKWNDNHI